ncbi:unnamed protein product [Cuscuta campestris]|uniref:Retrotransposon gag domain-containing protein n=1 Tax=Cuscuta campestris TaxID=132261 RepID=A0A484MRU2_9ASTE|nr:unnamed protein product [Cuscuta campestris]
MSTREALTNVMDLNCPTFEGSGSINGAHRWMRRVVDTFRDLGLSDDLRIQIAPELLVGAARVWWERTKRRLNNEPTWFDFVREFNTYHYSPVDQEHFEAFFFGYRQGDNMVREYQEVLRSASLFLPEYSTNDEMCSNRFMAGLNPRIRQIMHVPPASSFEDLVLIAEEAEIVWKGENKENSKVGRTRRDAQGSSTHRVGAGDQLKEATSKKKKKRSKRCHLCGELSHAQERCNPDETRPTGGPTRMNPTRYNSDLEEPFCDVPLDWAVYPFIYFSSSILTGQCAQVE